MFCILHASTVAQHIMLLITTMYFILRHVPQIFTTIDSSYFDPNTGMAQLMHLQWIVSVSLLAYLVLTFFNRLATIPASLHTESIH